MNQYESGGLWSKAAHETAAALWSEGVSAGVISARIREEHDLSLSRSAEIGRMRRTGIQQGDRDGKPKVARPAPTRAPSPPPKTPSPPQRIEEAPWRPPTRPVEPLAPQPEGGVRLVETRGSMCRFIAGEPTADALCCGAGTAPGSSWCPAHRAILFRPG
ncbi:GcrA family cell cycle regulator [Methylobacterium sp. M6A4_1b]